MMKAMISTRGSSCQSDALPADHRASRRARSRLPLLGGMMDKQSKTFAGAMSNIKDAIDQTLSKRVPAVVQGAGDAARSRSSKFTGSKQFTTWANNAGRVVVTGDVADRWTRSRKVFADPTVQKSIGRLGKSLGSAFSAVGPAVSKILPDLIKFGKDALPAIIDTMTGIVDKVPTLLKWWERLSGGLAAAGPAIGGHDPVPVRPRRDPIQRLRSDRELRR
jgi:hypothetical protein